MKCRRCLEPGRNVTRFICDFPPESSQNLTKKKNEPNASISVVQRRVSCCFASFQYHPVSRASNLTPGLSLWVVLLEQTVRSHAGERTTTRDKKKKSTQRAFTRFHRVTNRLLTFVAILYHNMTVCCKKLTTYLTMACSATADFHSWYVEKTKDRWNTIWQC